LGLTDSHEEFYHQERLLQLVKFDEHPTAFDVPKPGLEAQPMLASFTTSS
jgi:hypothetical protein